MKSIGYLFIVALESLIALLYDQLPSLEADHILGYLFNSLVTSSHSLELMILIIFFVRINNHSTIFISSFSSKIIYSNRSNISTIGYYYFGFLSTYILNFS